MFWLCLYIYEFKPKLIHDSLLNIIEQKKENLLTKKTHPPPHPEGGDISEHGFLGNQGPRGMERTPPPPAPD